MNDPPGFLGTKEIERYLASMQGSTEVLQEFCRRLGEIGLDGVSVDDPEVIGRGMALIYKGCDAIEASIRERLKTEQ